MGMHFETLQDKLKKYTNRGSLRAEEALQLMLTLCDDIRWETGQPVAACKTDSGDRLVDCLISLSKTLQQLYRNNEGQIAGLRRAANGKAAQEQLSRLTADCEAVQARLAQAQQQRQTLEAEAQRLDQQKQALGEKLALCQSLTREVETAQKELRVLEETDLPQLVQDRDQWQVRLSSAKEALASAEAERNRLAMENQDLQRQLREGTQRKEALSAEADALRQQLEQARSQAVELEEQNRQLADTRQNCTDSIRRMQQEAITLRLELDNLKSSNEAYRTDVLEKARSEYTKRREEKDSLLQEKEQLETRSAGEKAQIQAFSARINQLQTEIGILQIQAQKAAGQVEELNARKEALVGQISKVSQSCETTQHCIQELEQQLRDMDAETMEQTLARRQQTLEEAIARCRAQQAQQGNLEKAIQEKQRQISVTEAELCELQKSQSLLQQQLKQLDEVLYPLGEDTYRTKVNQLRARLELLKGIRDRLERDSAKLRGTGGFRVELSLQTELDIVRDTLDTLHRSIVDYADQWQSGL